MKSERLFASSETPRFGRAHEFFLTVGTGYIGSNTAVVLLQSGHRVVLYDNLSNSSDAVLEKLAQITGQPIPFIKGDVRDTELLKGTLTAHRIDSVVQFAGLKAVVESVEKPVDYYANNIQCYRLSNPGTIPLEIIEVQSGSYLGEDDIVRFEDTCGRHQ